MKKILLLFFVLMTLAPSVMAFSSIYDDRSSSNTKINSYKSYSSNSALSNTAYNNAKQNARDGGGMRESYKSASYNRSRAFGNFRQRSR